MSEEINETLRTEIVIDRFKTVAGEDAEVVQLNEDFGNELDEELRPLAQLLAETDLKDSTFCNPNEVDSLKVALPQKKLRQLKEMLTSGEAFVIRINGKIISVQGMIEKGKLPSGRPLMELTKAATLKEYGNQKLAKILATYLIQLNLRSKPNSVLVSFSRNPLVISALTRNGWEEIALNEPHQITDSYLASFDADTALKLAGDGYKILFFDPKRETSLNAAYSGKTEEVEAEIVSHAWGAGGMKKAIEDSHIDCAIKGVESVGQATSEQLKRFLEERFMKFEGMDGAKNVLEQLATPEDILAPVNIGDFLPAIRRFNQEAVLTICPIPPTETPKGQLTAVAILDLSKLNSFDYSSSSGSVICFRRTGNDTFDVQVKDLGSRTAKDISELFALSISDNNLRS